MIGAITSNTDSLNDLILAHLWIVRAIAGRLKNSLLFSADWDELISTGNLALVKAAHNYEARNECQFKTYAFKCVRGAMLTSFTRIDGHHDSARIEFEPLGEYPIPPAQESEVYRRERATILELLVNRLQPRHKEVIQVYVDEKPLTKFATSKGMKRDRIMKWQRTGIKQMVQAGSVFR